MWHAPTGDWERNAADVERNGPLSPTNVKAGFGKNCTPEARNRRSILSYLCRSLPQAHYFFNSVLAFMSKLQLLAVAYTVSSGGEGVKEWETVTGTQPREYTLCQFPLRNVDVILREVCESDIFVHF